MNRGSCRIGCYPDLVTAVSMPGSDELATTVLFLCKLELQLCCLLTPQLHFPETLARQSRPSLSGPDTIVPPAF